MILVLVTGALRPYSYLLTNIKSPIKRVGIIDPEGILKGSNMKVLITNTIKIIGNNEIACLVIQLGFSFFDILLIAIKNRKTNDIITNINSRSMESIYEKLLFF
jgi:hypothetical protein